MRLLLLLSLLTGLCLPLRALSPVTPHPTRGIVIHVDRGAKQIDVSCDAIPGYMGAMEMSFAVRDANALERLRPGAPVTFVSVVRGKTLYAEEIHPGTTASFSREPIEAGTLGTLAEILTSRMGDKTVQPGEPVPDFTLVDQIGRSVELSRLRGKVVALTFGYSRCPYPDFCARLSTNFAQLQERFHADAGHDLVLLTIAIDPEHDQGKVLSDYAKTWKADPAMWHFLTGSPASIRAAAGPFGMDFWSSEGLLTHPLHTAIIDRGGKLLANLDGNRFTAKQLGDLVQDALTRHK